MATTTTSDAGAGASAARSVYGTIAGEGIGRRRVGVDAKASAYEVVDGDGAFVYVETSTTARGTKAARRVSLSLFFERERECKRRTMRTMNGAERVTDGGIASCSRV